MGITDPIRDVVGALNPLAKGGQAEQDSTTAHAADRRPAQGGVAEESEEVRVARAEDEFDVSAVRRQTGSVAVNKTVQSETEQVEVPVRREEVQVDRVPAGQSSQAATIGAEQIRVPIYEEETVVTKPPVVKEEPQIRKDVHTAARQRSAAEDMRSDADQLGALAGRKRRSRKTS